MKKFGYMAIGAIFTIMLSVGLITLADSTSTEDVEVQGLEQGFQNSEENQFEEEIAEENETAVELIEEVPVLLVSETEQFEETEELIGLSPVDNSFLDELETLEIELESEQTKIEIKQERKKKRVKSKVEIELKHEKMKLKDHRAEEFLENLFATIEVNSNKDLELIADKLLQEFQMNDSEVEIELKVEKLDGTKYKLEIEN